MKNLKIVHYDDKYWNLVKEFIEKNWRKDHPMCNEKLSNWQYRGFGKNAQKHKTFLLFNNSELIGFRGTIPALFQVPLDKGEMKIVTGGSSSMWSIDKYHNKKDAPTSKELHEWMTQRYGKYNGGWKNIQIRIQMEEE